MSQPRKQRENVSVPTLLVQGALPQMLLLSVATVAGGTAAATLRGNLEIFPATLCLIFSLLTQVSATYWHFYVKTRSTDDANEAVDADFFRLPKTSVLREAALGVGILAATVGLALVAMAGTFTIIVGVLLLCVIYVTFGGRHPATDSPWGVLCTFLLFGPIGVIGTCLMQSGHEAGSLLNFYDVEPAIYISGILGFMAVNCGLLHGVVSMDSDKKDPARHTFPMRFGIGATRVLFFVNGLLWTALCAALCYVQHIQDWYWYMGLPVAILAVNCWIGMRLGGRDDSGTIQYAVNLNMLVMAVAMLVVSFFVGAADDSYMYFI